jgi:hypothetical protein
LSEPEIAKLFAEVVEDYTAGDPQDNMTKWVGLKPKQIQEKLRIADYEVSYYIIHQLLANAGFRQRSYLKSACMGNTENRNAQFEKINGLKAHFLNSGLPVLSIDTKKKEMLGNFYRKGTYFDKKYRNVFDHDFNSYSDGIVVPHGLYDIADNYGYISLGRNKNTSEFVCDNIEHFWVEELQWKYTNADWMLILCDGGGSNNASHYIVKQDFYNLAQKLDINIVIAHYPPYCSKWNPIEHRLFSQVHRSWKGAVFQNIELVKELAEATTTSTGLNVKVRINKREYQIKRNVNSAFKANLKDYVTFDQILPKWNYFFKAQNRKLIY